MKRAFTQQCYTTFDNGRTWTPSLRVDEANVNGDPTAHYGRGDTLFFNEPAELIIARRFDEIDELSFEQRAATLAPRDEAGQPLPAEQLPGKVAMRERRPTHGLFHIHGYDGVLRAVEATAIPIESAGGHVLGAMVILWRRPEGKGPDGSPPGPG